MRYVRFFLPVSFATFVGWWLSTFECPRAKLMLPHERDTNDQCFLAVSPHGRFLVSHFSVSQYVGVQPAESVQFWDLRQGRFCQSLRQDDDLWHGATFSPDDRLLAVPTKKNTVRLWNPTTGQCESEFPRRTSIDRWWHNTRLAFTKAGTLIDFCDEDAETTLLYEVKSRRELSRLPKGAAGPLVADIIVHASKSDVRLFHLGDEFCFSKPFKVMPSIPGHAIAGCTLDGKVLFGTRLEGTPMTSGFLYYRDFDRNIGDEIDSLFGQAFLCPSWTGQYVVKTEPTAQVSSLPQWIRKWLPKRAEKGLVLRDYQTKDQLLVIPDGKSSAFSHDDRVMAVYVGNRQIQIWDLPLRLPWLSMIVGALGAWAGSFLVIQSGIWLGRRRKLTVTASSTATTTAQA